MDEDIPIGRIQQSDAIQVVGDSYGLGIEIVPKGKNGETIVLQDIAAPGTPKEPEEFPLSGPNDVLRGDKAMLNFDLGKIQEMNTNREKTSLGLTLVMGGPFEQTFKDYIAQEQRNFQEIFARHGLADALVLYGLDDVHATLIGLDGVKKSNRQDVLLPEDLEYSQFLSDAAKGQEIQKMNLGHVLTWSQQQQPFDVDLGPRVLKEGRQDQVIRVTPDGLIVMKGRARDRTLLSRIRAEFEVEANIRHKYGREDDEFFFVIGYLRPNPSLVSNTEFTDDLDAYLTRQRQEINVSTRINGVKVVSYSKTTLQQDARRKELELSLGAPAPTIDMVDYFADKAQLAPDKFGGIDLNEIELNRQGSRGNIQFDPAAIQPFLEAGVDGFSPEIIGLTRINNVLSVLGLEPKIPPSVPQAPAQ